LSEAAALLDTGEFSARAVAGGTALMLMMKTGLYRPGRLVSLRAVEPRCFEIAEEPGGVRMGAMTTLSALGRSPLVRNELPVIAGALSTLSNVRVRNVATLGGHLAHADPHMDLPPVLIALGARVGIVDPGGYTHDPARGAVLGVSPDDAWPRRADRRGYRPTPGRAARLLSKVHRALRG
jgi:carbon-monoxide dehydrogenase medium subunit